VASEFHLDSFGNEMRPAREPKENLVPLSVTEDILTEIDNMSITCHSHEGGNPGYLLNYFPFWHAFE